MKTLQAATRKHNSIQLYGRVHHCPLFLGNTFTWREGWTEPPRFAKASTQAKLLLASSADDFAAGLAGRMTFDPNGRTDILGRA